MAPGAKKKETRKRKKKVRKHSKPGRPRIERAKAKRKPGEERFDRHGEFARAEGVLKRNDEVFGPLPIGRA